MKDRKKNLIAREAVFVGIRVVIFCINCMSLFHRFYTMNENILYQMLKPTTIILHSKIAMFDFVQSCKGTMI